MDSYDKSLIALMLITLGLAAALSVLHLRGF